MPAIKDRKRPPTKLYQQDIVQHIAPPHSYGVVLRCWHDAEDVPPPPHHTFADPILRPLKYGEVGVSFITNQCEREVLKESELRLVDRTLQPGDFCKRAVDDVRSGVVTNVRVKGSLAHVINGQMVSGWKNSEDLQDRKRAEIGDYVAYNDWIGQVLEVFDESLVELQSNGQIVRLPELSSRLNVGERGADIMPPPLFTNLTSMIDSVLGNRASMDTVLDVKHTIYAISWLAVNQSLDPAEAEKRQRPKKFWTGKDICELTLIQGRSDMEMRVGDRVHLKDITDLPVTQHGQEGTDVGVVTVDTYLVTETETALDVLWQSGEKETILAKDVIPYLNPDEYDCWPGDYVMWKSEDEKRTAIIQSVNAIERTATVLVPSTGTTELASLLELDPHGASDLSALVPQSPGDGLGVRRGDFVFIHRPGTTNGFEKPRVPRIGELEAWVREVPYNDGQLTGWRKEMAEIGAQLAESRNVAEEFHMKRPSPGSGEFSWIGEVTGLNLDGTVEVTHPNWTTRTYSLESLTRLYDGIEQLEDDLFDQEASDHDSAGEEEEVWTMEEDGVWRPEKLDSDDNWVDEDEDMIYNPHNIIASHGAADLDLMDLDVNGWGGHPGPSPPILSPSSVSDEDLIWDELSEEATVTHNRPADTTDSPIHMTYSPASITSSLTIPQLQNQPLPQTDSNLVPPHATMRNSPTYSSAHSGASSLSKEFMFKDRMENNANEVAKNDDLKELTWKRFDILPCAPADHAFYSSAPAQPAKSFLNRLNREYRALANSLPDTIIVKAYEDRSDLLRSLIIGPENTPYEDAPFVIDWMLDANFPNTPPIAHFLSWTNGNGRVNPNLYEEGKVCLSILGTWAGDRNETWNAARSSLLQAFVSIQGLVLVKEPWFCEPAYEKLRGTEEGTVNSRLYNEKAYVLSRGFVRRALEIPLGSLEEEINWLYYTHGRLHKVLEDSRRLIEESRSSPNPSKEELERDGMAEVAVPRLTAGGIITLERTLGKLQGLFDAYTLREAKGRMAVEV